MSMPLSTALASDEQLAANAHEVQERIRAHLGTMKRLWVDVAADLHVFADQELWKRLGYGSFEAWLATPEIGLERRHVYRLLSAYRQLVVERKVEPARLAELDISKVDDVLPAVRRGHVTVDEALADVEVLPRNDLRQRYQEITSRSPGDPEPPLDAMREPERTQCPACGSWLEVRR